MKAFILAAGLGTRLRPLTEKQPKVMVEVGGQKILERTIDQLRAAGVDEFIINTHYFPEIVPNYFGDGHKWGVKIEYSHERDILGTAGGLKKVEERFRSEKEFLVVYGDNVFDLDFSPFIQKPLAAERLIMQTAPETPITSRAVSKTDASTSLRCFPAHRSTTFAKHRYSNSTVSIYVSGPTTSS
jgi:NDP-sugar pyrophosphorylase family protein